MRGSFLIFLAISIAPFLFGSVNQEGKAVVGILLSLSLLLTVGQGAPPRFRFVKQGYFILLLLWFTIPTVPIPQFLMEFFSPARVALHNSFSLDSHVPQSPWLTLTLSLPRSINRLWELRLYMFAFFGVRRAIHNSKDVVMVAYMLTTAVFLQGAIDILQQFQGNHSVLGLWNKLSPGGGGTFQNRNHFATWIAAASLLPMALVLREFKRIQIGDYKAHGTSAVSYLKLTGFISAITTGCSMAIFSASRGGMIALGAGTILLILAVFLRHRDSKTGIVVFLCLFAFLCGGLFFSDSLMNRMSGFSNLASESSIQTKLRIWGDAMNIAKHHILVGTGPGTFLPAYRLYRSHSPDIVAVHAENDFLQLLVEHGILGIGLTGVTLGVLFIKLWRKTLTDKTREQELLFGFMAAASTIFVAGLYDFVWQLPATAMLGCASLGAAAGIIDLNHRPLVPAPYSRKQCFGMITLGATVLTIAGIQLASFISHWQATRLYESNDYQSAYEKSRLSKTLWPWGNDRQLSSLRSLVQSLADASPLKVSEALMGAIHQLDRYLKYDKFNWELHYEVALARLLAEGASQAFLRSAIAASKSNPLQSKIPKALAKLTEKQNPEICLELIRLIPPADVDRSVFEMALRLGLEPSVLWSIVPTSEEALKQFATVAFEHNHHSLGLNAVERISSDKGIVELATRMISFNAFDVIIQLMGKVDPTPQANLLLAEAYLGLGNAELSLRHSKSIWENTQGEDVKTPAPGKMSIQEASLLSLIRSKKLHLLSPKEINEARALASNFPTESSIQRTIFQMEMDLGEPLAAAKCSLQIARLSLRKSP